MAEMQSADDAPRSFLRVDEFNETNGQANQLASSQQDGSGDDSWPAQTDPLRDSGPPPTDDTADTGQPAESRSPGRPTLRRDQWAPVPQHPPPPVPSDSAAEDGDVTTDSLSLAQLRRIVQDMPKKEATPYAFEYQDTSTFEEEVEELFDYSTEDRACLNFMSSSFDEVWQRWQAVSSGGTDNATGWTNLEKPKRQEYLRYVKKELVQLEELRQRSVVAALCYMALGCWKETASQQDNFINDAKSNGASQAGAGGATYGKSHVQIAEMKLNIVLIGTHIGVEPVFSAAKLVCREMLPDNASNRDAPSDSDRSSYGFLLPRCCVILLYLLVDFAKRLQRDDDRHPLVLQCVEIAPALLDHLTTLLADMRWNESSVLSLPKILPLFWKTILIAFGGIRDARDLRDTLNQAVKDQSGETAPLISASPLDYHLFRQEITSKYPAFDPPQPLFPFEADTTSMIPPLPDHSRLDNNNEKVGPANVNSGGSSILHQPVHIATPAPSPPPSPAGPGGKGIKKQNYQTNQLFPFLYPPLDDSSNSIGGKGGTELQDLLVGRKWEGRDIPTSILEAADIFATRMRATRAMKQLWDERVRFLKYERGYLTSLNDVTGDAEDNNSSKGENPDAETRKARDDSSLDILDETSRKRLAAVEQFYTSQLPRLQSLVIVLLKVLLQTVTTLVTQPNAPNGLQTGFESPEQNPQDKPQVNGINGNDHTNDDTAGLDNINTIRSQEIMGKSVSAILLLLLKWFKLSHVLKFEYFTQLLLDSNYVQLILKLFTHQELERAVNVKCEKQSLNFFNWCRRDASSASSSPNPNSASEPTAPTHDDAIPPPIPRSTTAQRIDTQEHSLNEADPPLTAAPPEVDELGYSTSPLQPPITNFSWRTFFSSINHLRILQKIVKAKPHRQLLMVQYKYSNILKKSLKVPQPDVRLYTLKIIKGQVPYCHRKWRQSNMRIITAIYLHCKPELRDDWLAGLTMEEEMGEALPQEQALRSLTYWHNLRRYPQAMTNDVEKARGLLEEEQDFFVRELEGMEAALGDGNTDADVDPLDSAADAGGWSQQDREAFLTRTREIVDNDERNVRW